MFRNMKSFGLVQSRTHKNFGHKNNPDSIVTIIWTGFLTFTFIGLGIEWKKIARMMFGSEFTETDDLLVGAVALPAEEQVVEDGK